MYVKNLREIQQHTYIENRLFQHITVSTNQDAD